MSARSATICTDCRRSEIRRAEDVAAGRVRNDVPPKELAAYCVHAPAAGVAPSKAAVRRLVAVTLAGLRSQVPEQGESEACTGSATAP
ncbi:MULTISPECIES: hypothetical protein [Kribbella]|uniref:hypothetical protein n=1 Tax=Kribbella TaxID=182639 RepID=UPI0010501F1F|nr:MULTISPECIES: hypothetical protein [Kribbella]